MGFTCSRNTGGPSPAFSISAARGTIRFLRLYLRGVVVHAVPVENMFSFCARLFSGSRAHACCLLCSRRGWYRPPYACPLCAYPDWPRQTVDAMDGIPPKASGLRHTLPCHTIICHTLPYHTTPYYTIPYHTTPPRRGGGARQKKFDGARAGKQTALAPTMDGSIVTPVLLAATGTDCSRLWSMKSVAPNPLAGHATTATLVSRILATKAEVAGPESTENVPPCKRTVFLAAHSGH